MEIIDRDEGAGGELVQIAFTDTREEAALVRGLLREAGIRSLAKQTTLNGPSLGGGLLGSSPRRIYVRPDSAAAARTLLSETMVEEPAEEIPESANARYLAEAVGHKPRDYSMAGAYGRALLVAIVIGAIVLGIFLLLR